MRSILQVLVVLFAALITASLLTGAFPREAGEESEAIEIIPLEVRDLESPSELEALPPVVPPPTPQREQEPSPTPPPTPQPEPPPIAITPPSLSLSDNEFYLRFAGSVIQIYCVTREQSFSASGVIVNERGLILTNAHVADVIKNSGQENCQARHGNPAEPFARLRVIFEADTTAKVNTTKVPQRDIAFLLLEDVKGGFSAASVSLRSLERDEPILTLGYPSEFLAGLAASQNANLLFSSLTIAELADIEGDGTTADVYVFRGGLALQQGSSGTPIFSNSGEVAGLLFATTKGATTAEREGIALTTSFIDRILRIELGIGLLEFIAAR